MQYARHVVIQQLAEEEFVLKVNDPKLAAELKVRLPPVGFGRYMSVNEINNECHFKISGMDKESLKRHLEPFPPSILDELSSD